MEGRRGGRGREKERKERRDEGEEREERRGGEREEEEERECFGGRQLSNMILFSRKIRQEFSTSKATRSPKTFQLLQNNVGWIWHLPFLCLSQGFGIDV